MPFEIEYFHPKVLSEIESWPVDLVARYARTVELLIEFGPTLKLPHSRTLGQGLFELRISGKSSIGRAMYCFVKGKRIVIVHAFVKKISQTPDTDLKLARKRMREVTDG